MLRGSARVACYTTLCPRAPALIVIMLPAVLHSSSLTGWLV